MRTKPFFWKSMEAIKSLKSYGFNNGKSNSQGLTGVSVRADDDSSFSEHLGGSFRHPLFYEDHLPAQVQEVRVYRSSRSINEIEFIGNGKKASTGNFGLRTDPMISQYLEIDEKIVGVFGESYDETN